MTAGSHVNKSLNGTFLVPKKQSILSQIPQQNGDKMFETSRKTILSKAAVGSQAETCSLLLESETRLAERGLEHDYILGSKWDDLLQTPLFGNRK